LTEPIKSMNRKKVGQPKIGLGPLNQARPFSVILDAEFKQALQDRSNETGKTYWVFFTTSGQARVEPMTEGDIKHAQYKPVFEVKPNGL
jgi:hypothetical protein